MIKRIFPFKLLTLLFLLVLIGSTFSQCDDADLFLAIDTTAPSPGNSGTITTSGISATGLTLNWTVASDAVSAETTLTYRVFYSTSANIATVGEAIANGTEVDSSASNIIIKTVSGLTASTTYYFNVIVKDGAGNQAAYTIKTQATTAIPDIIPPIPGAGGVITTSSVSATSLTLNWTKATDAITPQTSLVYVVYRSTANNIGTVALAEANGTPLNGAGTTDIATYNVTGLTVGTTYFFNVLVKDAAGNKAAYSTVSQATISYAVNPVLTGTYNTSGSAQGVTVSGNYAYVADLTSGLQIIQVLP